MHLNRSANNAARNLVEFVFLVHSSIPLFTAENTEIAEFWGLTLAFSAASASRR
jgi:hypothetical protein